MQSKKIVASLMALVCVSSLNLSNYDVIVNNIEISAEDNYLTRDPFYNFNSEYNYYTTEHFQFIWGNTGDSSQVTQEFLTENGKNLEACWNVYMNTLGMEAPSQSTDISLRDGNNYKVNIYISGTGLSNMEDDWAYMSYDNQGYAYMFCCTGAMLYGDNPSWVLPHEFGHVVTAHQLGWNDNKYSYAWWEAMGNWFREQCLYNGYDSSNTGYGTDFFETYLKNMSLTSPCGRDYYSSWVLLQYLTENPDNLDGYGTEFVKTMLQQGQKDEYPLKMIDRLANADLKETLGNFGKRLATLDFQNQDSYKARLNELLQNGSWNYQNIYTFLEKSEIDNWYRVPTEKAPQQAGVNVIPLEISGNSITATLQGLTDVQGADWRACIVAEDNNGNSYYSDLFGNNESKTLTLPSGVTNAYLTVVATPDTDTMVECGLPYGEGSEFAEENYTFQSKIRYPYQVKIEGATIKQRIVDETSQYWNTYHVHENGGGIVSDGAIVDDTVYVGKNAKILGNAIVTGNVIVDGYAVIEGSANVSGNAIIDGNAIISENATIKDNAYITDNAMVMGNSIISGNAKVIESGLVFGNYTVSDNAVIKGMAYCMANGSASGQGMADGDYYDDSGKTIIKGTAYGWVSSQSYVDSLNYTDGTYAKYEFNINSSHIVNDEYTSTYGVAVNAPTWESERTSAKGVLTFDGSNYISFDRSLAYFDNVEYQTAILWRGGSGDIFSFGDDNNYMTLSIEEDGKIMYQSYCSDNGGIFVGTSTNDYNLEKGKWYTIKLSILDDNYDGTDVYNYQIVIDDGEDVYVSPLVALSKDIDISANKTPLDVARATDSNSFIFGKFNGSADYFRVSYKESANDNSYYYTETENISEDVTTTTTTTATDETTNPFETTGETNIPENPLETTTTLEENPEDMLLGDVNSDKEVNPVDVLLLKKYLLGMVSINDINVQNSDIDKDYNINVLDLLYIKKHVLGIKSLF